MSDPTYFDIFDLPRRFALDRAELERRYRERSRQWHPDRHGRAPAAERIAVLQRATDLNQAYRVLKDDWQRAAYLLRLHGIDVTAETPEKRLPLPPGFLMEIMEQREELAEATAARDDGKVQALDRAMRARLQASRERVGAAFLRLEAGESGAPEMIAAIAAELVAQRYYQRFREEIEAYEEARAEAAGSIL